MSLKPLKLRLLIRGLGCCCLMSVISCALVDGVFGAGPLNLGFERLSIEEGLSQSIVACILQDRRGFLWFGTEEGLNRYDGYNFKVYKQISGNRSSLSHGNIISLLQGRDGALWIGTFHGGLNRYDPQSDRFTRYRRSLAPNSKSGPSDEVVRAVIEDRDGILWLGTDGGLNRFDPKRQIFEVYQHQPDNPRSLSQDEVYALCEDREGNLWIGTNGGGLNKYDRKGNSFSVYRPRPDYPLGSGSDRISAIHQNRSGSIWVGTNGGGLYRFEPNSGWFTSMSSLISLNPVPTQECIFALYEDKDGILWVGTGQNGLIGVDVRNNTTYSHQYSPVNIRSLSSNEVRSIYEDRSGVLWVGTYGGGITKIRKRQFSHYQVDPSNPNGLSNNIVWSILEEDSGALWIGTHGGLDRLDRQTNQYTHFQNRPGDPKSLSNNIVRLVYQDRAGSLWLATHGGGLNRLDRRTGEFTSFQHDPNNPYSISHNEIRTLYEDNSGNFWVGTHGGGLNLFDRRSGRFTRYLPKEGDPTSLSSNIVRHLLQDHRGVLWVATYGGGLCTLDPSTGRFFTYRANPDEPEELNNDFLFALHEDRRHNLWIATWGGGLNKLNPERTTFSHYGVLEGLPSNSIYGILEDEQGYLWISSLNGLSRFDPQSSTIENYNEIDGLQSNEFNGGSYFMSKSGEMFFGGIRGFNAFFPSAIRENRTIPQVVITSFQKMNKDFDLGRPISAVEEITLSYRDYFFSFEFSSLDFTVPAKNRYAYRLHGLDTDWIYTPSTRRFASYTNLKPGEYRFQVKASNSDGVWNQEGASIRIVVTPPFWKTWTFTVLLAAGLVGLLAFAYRLRTTRLTDKLETKRLENELKLKADFTAMLVHELRTPLTAVMGYADALRAYPDRLGVKKTCDVIVQSSERMLALINDMLDYAKFEAGKMVLLKKEVALFPLLTGALELLQPLFQQKEIQVSCDVHPEVQGMMVTADADKITQVINNLLSNAVKFSPVQGTVRISARDLGQGFLEVAVEDNGGGIPSDQRKHLFDQYVQLNNQQKVKGTGLGLTVSKYIVEAHGGTIGFREPPPGRGSQFFFTLPICPKAESNP